MYSSLAFQAAATLSPETVERYSPADVPDTGHWREWLPAIFPDHFSDAFGEHHAQFWDWVWAIEQGQSPARPFVGIWPRGGGKSSSAEAAVVALGRRRRRRFVLYVSGSQDQANEHVQSIASLLESERLERDDPDLSARSLNKYGNSKGWRHSRLHTRAGLVVAALGLDVNVRGIKVDNQRPDLIVLDDIDNEADSQATTLKKITRITKAILPAASDDVAILAIQNLISPDGVFARLAKQPGEEGAADFLVNRIISGPIPALYDMAYEQDESGRFIITAGRPAWEGQGLERCQAMVDEFGLTAFLHESQHDVEEPDGGLFSHLHFRRCERDAVPDLVDIAVWVDPAVSNTDRSDSHGIQIDGLGEDGLLYRLWSWEQVTSPRDSLTRAILKAVEFGALTVGVETDQGGETWREVYDAVVKDLRRAGAFLVDARPALVDGEVVVELEDPDALADLRAWLDYDPAAAGQDAGVAPARPPKPMEYPIPRFKSAKAGSGQGSKSHRASQMLADYEAGRIVHVLGTHQVLERALRRFPVKKPYDLVDAAYWCWKDLLGGRGASWQSARMVG